MHTHTYTHTTGDKHINLLCPSNLTHGIVADLVGVRRTLQIPLSNLATTRRIEACLLAISIRLVHSVPQFAVSWRAHGSNVACPWLVAGIVQCLHTGHAQCVGILLFQLCQHVEVLRGTRELRRDMYQHRRFHKALCFLKATIFGLYFHCFSTMYGRISLCTDFYLWLIRLFHSFSIAFFNQ